MKTASGVYFRRTDYAPLWLRFVVDIIDMVVAGVGAVALLLLWTALTSRFRAADIAIGIGSVAFCYFVLLKRTRFGTVGYRIGGVRIVGLNGLPAGYLPLTERLVFAFLGPMNWILDLMFLSTDPHRQAIRDKFAHTYVIRKHAQPAGIGQIVYRSYEILVYHFLFCEVEVPAEPRP